MILFISEPVELLIEHFALLVIVTMVKALNNSDESIRDLLICEDGIIAVAIIRTPSSSGGDRARQRLLLDVAGSEWKTLEPIWPCIYMRCELGLEPRVCMA